MVGPAHSTLSGVDLHEDKRVKAPVNAASIAQVSLTAPGSTIDGVTLASGNRILLKNQTAPAENGIYVWSAASAALTRATDADASADFTLGFLVFVAAGTVNAASLWMFSQTATFTLGTTAATFTSPQGVQGAQGATGASGVQGATGPAGPPTTVTAAFYVCIQEQQPSGTASQGTFTAGAFRTRTLNSVVANDASLATLLSNQITLPAGSYRCAIRCPAQNATQHQARLQNITDAVTLVTGSSGSSQASSLDHSFVIGRFSLATAKVLEVQQRFSGGAGGPAASFGTEVYTVAEFWMEGLPSPVSQGMGLQPNPSFDKTYRRRQSAWNAM